MGAMEGYACRPMGKYVLHSYYLLTCVVWSVCAFINSDKVLNNENSMKIKQLANPFQLTCTSCNQVSYSTNLPSQ